MRKKVYSADSDYPFLSAFVKGNKEHHTVSDPAANGLISAQVISWDTSKITEEYGCPEGANVIFFFAILDAFAIHYF